MTSKLKTLSSKNFKDTTKMILQDNEKSIHSMQKGTEKTIVDKDEEICHLKNHSQSLIRQIKKVENDKQSLQGKLVQVSSKD